MSLKSVFDNPPVPTPDLSGQGVVARGTDPLTDVSGASGLKTFFDKPIDPSMEGEETANPVSGLPLRPARWEPSESSVEPPSLQDRNPGTIDRR